MNSYEQTAEDAMLYNYMDEMRDKLLDSMTRLERAALFQDFDEFKHLWNKEQSEAYYES